MKTRVLGVGCSYYHVFSRINGRKFLLGPGEKTVFRDMMWRVAEFSGVNILTYCVMDNHFHILVEVPDREDIPDKELMRRLNVLYSGQALADVMWEFECARNNQIWRDGIRQKYLRRMFDLSEFMRTLKLRFSFWYNSKHNRQGTLWDARFKSVLVEGTVANHGQRRENTALATVAAYIDLNAVRAGAVNDPADYHWCGYGEATAGRRLACTGIGTALQAQDGEHADRELLAVYRAVLCQKGGVGHAGPSLSAMLRSRNRYFTAGAVLGSQRFVDAAVQKNHAFFGDKRNWKARGVPGGDEWEGLYSARSLATP